MKYISIIFFILGLGFIGYSSYQIWDSKSEQKAALQRAEQLVTNKEREDVEANTGPILFKPEVGEEIGLLSLPKIDATLPIVEGVDEDELKKGVGHYAGTSFPSEQGQIVLSGHRDTVFRRMGELEIGDELLVKMPYGDYTYIIEETEIVSADDLTVIRPDHDEEMLTVTTCYPFRYVGDAPDRYIIYAKPKQDSNAS
ncbi:class D sortase [Bacillus sp. FJAT-50079]|uniref:class D sortase n=1 Tax=Bacillus sp. FJAT-50079 TaxID=2833577 RepID=UPI001BC9B4D4|nr:class D sortase [Bacillus sp. FJAT-50079]